MITKSPSGSLCPYYFKGAELQPLHYGSYHDDFEGLARVVNAEEVFILASHGGRKVWVDLYETRLTKDACEMLARHFVTVGHKLSKLALVGCGWRAKRYFRQYLRQRGAPPALAFFSDPELAKNWLVGVHPPH